MKKQHKSTAGPILNRIRSLLAFRHQNPVARLVSAVVAFAIAGLLVGVNLSPVQAVTPCVLSGGFEIDGNMDAGTCSGDDWGAHQLTPTGDVDHTTQGGTYSSSSKDSNDPTTWSSAGSTPSKADFERAYALSNTAMVSGHLHYFVYVAWERTSSTGTQGYAVEIDNSPTRVGSDGSPQPDRSQGGTVYFLSAQGSSAPTFARACTFSSQVTYTANCTTSPAGVTAATNSGDITDSFTSLTQGAGTFYEIGLDITALTGKAPSCPGPSAASVYLRSLTGNIDNSDNLKGYMEPLSVAPDSTCVAPHIATTATPGNSLIDGLHVTTPGSAQHDNVTVDNGSGSVPGVGTVKFYLCQPGTVTTNGGDCSAGGTLVSTKTLDVNGQASSDAVDGTTTPNDNALGTYCWRAEFTPGVNDHNYLSGSHTNSTTECFTVAKATPTLTTLSSADTDTGAATNSVGFTTIGDTATLSGVYSGADLTGQKVSFSLYGPIASTPGANDCVGSKLVSGPTDVALTQVDATTWEATAPTYKPTASDGPGYYTWVASYAGDAINVDVSGHETSSCGEDNANETQHLVGPLLTLTKGTPNSTITAGDDVVYDLNIKNVGDGTASNVVVTDVLPILTSGNTWSLNGTSGYNCSIAAGTGGNTGHQVVTCNIGDLNPLPDLTQIAEVTATTTPADCGTISNSAELTADPNVDQTVGPRTVTVQCPGLHITKTADAASVTVGNDIGFTVHVTNDGAGTATGVDISDPLPTGPGITWTIDTDPLKTNGPLSCSITAGTLHCTGSLDAGADQFVHVTSPTEWTGSGETEVNSCLGGTDGSGVYDNTATVTASNVTGAPNDNASEAVLCPDLHVTKVADAASVDAGSPIGFVITASNTGAAPATGAFVNDPLPTGVTWTIASQSGALSCSISAGTLSCSGTLAADASQVVHITAPTAFADCGVYNNTATFTATDSPQTPNDSDSATVLCSNLSLTKTADAASVNAGGQIGFTVTASNQAGEGIGTAKAVTINDPLPAGSGVDWSIASGASNCSIQGAPPAETLVCSAVDLASGASESVHVVSATTTASCATYPNEASLTADNAPALKANASTAVGGCVSPVVVVSPPKQHHPAVLPNTGGPDMRLLGAGLVLLLGGGLLVAGDRRRKHRS